MESNNAAMYDFIKLATRQSHLARDLQSNNNLQFSTGLNLSTSEIGYIKTASYQNMVFTIYPSNRVEIKGSLHKLSNEGLHNYNDFTIRNAALTIGNLCDKFNIDPSSARIHNLEIGVNLKTPFQPKCVLDNLVAYKNTTFNKMRTFGQGEGKEVYFKQYGIKMYNKGIQYKQPENILRFEEKIFVMQRLRSQHVYLKDLMQQDFAKFCAYHLITSFKDVIITEFIPPEKLSRREIDIYSLATNPRNWLSMSRNQRSRTKDYFNSIIETHGSDKLKALSSQLISDQLAMLLGSAA